MLLSPLGICAALGTLAVAALVYYLVTRFGNAGAATKGKRTVTSGAPQWEEYKCLERKQLTDDVYYFRFEGTLGGSVGNHMHIKGSYIDEESGARKEISRAYTPTTWHKTEGHFDLVIKKYPTGKLSPWISDPANIDAGRMVTMRKQASRLKYSNNKWKHVVLFGAGTGITPLYQVALHVANEAEENTKLTLIYQNRHEKNILLRDELASLEEKGVWSVHHVLSRPGDDWTGLKGRLSLDQVKAILGEAGLTTEMSQSGEVKCMICGPGGFNKSVKGHLKEMAFARPHVF